MINFIKKFKKVWNEKYLSLYFSILITLCFAAYNAFLGINYLAIWNGSIAVYYILLVALFFSFLHVTCFPVIVCLY